MSFQLEDKLLTRASLENEISSQQREKDGVGRFGGPFTLKSDANYTNGMQLMRIGFACFFFFFF